MPELPEVETTIKGLNILKNKKIIKINIHTKKLRYLIPNSINKILTKARIIAIKRIAKYILINFDNNFSLVVHLGMSGRLKIFNHKFNKIKHDHVVIYFEDKHVLVFNDPRKFGFIDLDSSPNILKKKYISLLGLDALSKRLNDQYMYDKIRKSEVQIKQILLNQHIVAGIGNIYASEILFDARISPLAKGKNINISQIMRLIKSIRKILKKAIKLGGSSIRDYKSADGTLGNFQNNFKVYNKQDKKVLNFKIKKIFQYGRSTYYCPKLQK